MNLYRVLADYQVKRESTSRDECLAVFKTLREQHVDGSIRTLTLENGRVHSPDWRESLRFEWSKRKGWHYKVSR